MKILAILVLGISFLFATVDINNASQKELTTLHNIGKAKAEAIVFLERAIVLKV